MIVTRVCSNNFWMGLRNTVGSLESSSLLPEVGIRVMLLALFVYADYQRSVAHVIQTEDLWHYRYPLKDSVVPYGHLLIIILFTTILVFGLFGSNREFKRIYELREAILGLTLSFLLAGVVINFMKLWIGRPRPHYLARCYGIENYLKVKDASSPCSEAGDWYGDKSKSFPSGHSGSAFSSLVFLSLYIAGKLGTFNSTDTSGLVGKGWRVVVTFVPTMMAVWVACTRFTDYHHHVEDIMVGSVIGSAIAHVSYRLYYPSLTSNLSHCPSSWLLLGYPRLGSRADFIMKPTARSQYPSDSELGLVIPIKDGPIPRDGGEISSVRNSRRVTRLASANTNGSINLEVYASRRPLLSPSIENNPDLSELSKASIAFYWDASSDEQLDKVEAEQVAAELKNALRDIQAPQSISSNVNY